MSVLVIMEQRGGTWNRMSWETLAAGQQFGGGVSAAVVGQGVDALAAELAGKRLDSALARLLPGALGDERSSVEDSFGDGLLDWPHYTRPEVFAGVAVPGVLCSGDHAAIERWRRKQSLGRTWLRRPELLGRVPLDAERRNLLAEFLTEQRDGAQR